MELDANTAILIQLPGAEPVVPQHTRARREGEALMFRFGCELASYALAAIAERRNTSKTVVFSAALKLRRGTQRVTPNNRPFSFAGLFNAKRVYVL